jgi:hypothetical protein
LKRAAKSITIKSGGKDELSRSASQRRSRAHRAPPGWRPMEGSQVTVMYGKDRVASEIRVTPKKP